MDIIRLDITATDIHKISLYQSDEDVLKNDITATDIIKINSNGNDIIILRSTKKFSDITKLYGIGFDKPIGASIEIYNPSGALKGFYQAGAGSLIDCDFINDEFGCNSFILRFSEYIEIDKRDTVKIRLNNQSEYIFNGVIRTIPIKGTTDLNYQYTGFGLNDYLLRLNTGIQTFTNQTVSYVIEYLLDNIITVNSSITKNTAKLDTISLNIGSITFKYIQIREALEQLQKLANSTGFEYIFGVDADGDFYFKARDEDIKATLTVGTFGDFGITDYAPTDSYEEISKYYVLDKDGNYYGTYSSTEDIDIYEKKLTAPDISDDDIENWALGQLYIDEQTQREAQIEWDIEHKKPINLTGDGNIRIISQTPPSLKKLTINPYGSGTYGSGLYGGEQTDFYIVDDTLKIINVSYFINKQEAKRTIQLGTRAVSLDKEIIDINKEVAALKVSLGR